MTGHRRLLVLLTLMAGCKLKPAASTTLDQRNPDAEAARPLIFVISQGFYSCTQRMNDAPARFEAILHRHGLTGGGQTAALTPTTFIESCFNGGMIDGGLKEELKYTIHRPGKARTPWRPINVTGFPAFINGVTETDGRDYGAPPRLFMVGHSHGAWLIMDAAARWRGAGTIEGLFTIDPISYRLCNGVNAILTRLVAGVTLITDRHCLVAPEDFEAVKPVIRAAVTGRWSNFFQRQSPFVSSSAIAEADQNWEMTRKVGLGRLSHADILFDDEVWAQIDTAVGEGLQAAVTRRAAAPVPPAQNQSAP